MVNAFPFSKFWNLNITGQNYVAWSVSIEQREKDVK